MAVTARYVVGIVFFSLSVVIWSTFGILLTLINMIKNHKLLFVRKDRSNLPSNAKNPALGVHDYVELSSSSTTTIPGVGSATSSHLEQTLKIKYVACGERGRPLMLCVHGFPECWYSWRYQLKEFSKKYWVVAIDLPGYGDSDKPADKANYDVRQLVDNLPGIIIELGYETATVVGHDWGGMLVWSFAQRYPVMCNKIVILNAANARGYNSAFSFKQYCMSWYVFFFQLPWLPEFLLGLADYKLIEDIFNDSWSAGQGQTLPHFLTKDDIDVYKYAMHSWDARRSAINYYRMLNFVATVSHSRSERKEERITSPVLLLWGTEDLALSLDLAVQSAKISDTVTLEFVEGAGHFVQQDKPEEVNKLMWEFLD